MPRTQRCDDCQEWLAEEEASIAAEAVFAVMVLLAAIAVVVGRVDLAGYVGLGIGGWLLVRTVQDFLWLKDRRAETEHGCECSQGVDDDEDCN